MSNASPKRTLPVIPNAEHLRRQAKARLAAMRTKSPGARLAEAQLVIAREYGFPNWPAMQAEVGKRNEGPLGQYRNVRRVHLALLPFERFRLGELPEEDVETSIAFFRAGAATQAGFIVAALVGVAMVMLAIGQPAVLQAAITLLRSSL